MAAYASRCRISRIVVFCATVIPRRVSVTSRLKVLRTWNKHRLTVAAVNVALRHAIVDKSLSTRRHLTCEQLFDAANFSRKLDTVVAYSFALSIIATIRLFPSLSTTSGRYRGMLRLLSLYVASNINTSPNSSKLRFIS